MLTSLGALLAGFVNGLLGTGGGTVALPFLERKTGSQQKAHGTVVLFVLPLCLLSLALYRDTAQPAWRDFLLLVPGTLAGAALGAGLLKKLNSQVLRLLFSAALLYSGIRMLV